MFQVGDKIFYPAYGGGIISTIVEENNLGTTQQYYVANIFHRNMRVMIPVDKTESLGMRHIVDMEKLDTMLATFHDGESELIVNDNQRYKRNMTKIRRGDIFEGAEVIRDLMRIRNKKKLGMMDQKMLDNAWQILLSEITLVKGIPEKQAADLLDQVTTMQ